MTEREPLRASVRIEGPSGNETVFVGGHAFPCSSVLLRMSAGGPSAISIALPIAQRTKVDVQDVSIFLDEATVTVLKELGWTPPKDPA